MCIPVNEVDKETSPSAVIRRRSALTMSAGSAMLAHTYAQLPILRALDQIQLRFLAPDCSDMAKKRVSIKDIADAAGVSHPTVSRALRGTGRMRATTRTRIVALAQEMGYTPSLIGRGLVTQRSMSIGLVVANFADPFHGEVAQGIEEEARRHGYSIFLASTTVDPERELAVVRGFQGRQVDGIIVSSSRVGNQYADLLQETGIPIVLINAHAEGNGIHVVFHDDRQGAREITKHLVARGYRRIAFLGNGRGGKVQAERQAGWQEALREAGLEPFAVILASNGRFHGGREAAETLLASRGEGALPDALVCYNDTMAVGAASVLHAAGLLIPGDVALTGFDGIDVTEYVDPPLTTWRQPRQAMGATAMRVMLALLDETNHANAGGGASNHRQVVMQGELVVRRST